MKGLVSSAETPRELMTSMVVPSPTPLMPMIQSHDRYALGLR